MTFQDLAPFIIFILIIAGAVVGAWWALRPPRPRHTCPQCGSAQIKRTGWEKPKRSFSLHPGSSKRRRFSMYAGLIVNVQTVYYQCNACKYKWDKKEGVPDIGRF